VTKAARERMHPCARPRVSGDLRATRRDHRLYTVAGRGSHTCRVIVDQGLELLNEAQCRQLLAGGEVGRVGISVGALPAIFPVNYRVIDGAIVYWTAPGSKMSAAVAGAVVAFEVDDYQVADRSGWSVLAVGRADVVTDPDLIKRVAATHLEPFADGARTTVVRIEPTFLSGRRLVHG
jgi:uncharacterized protein